MAGENAGGQADNSPNELEQPHTHLCSTHSSRPTQPSDCRDCDRERELAILKRRIGELESETLDLRGEVNMLREQVRGLDNALSATSIADESRWRADTTDQRAGESHTDESAEPDTGDTDTDTTTTTESN